MTETTSACADPGGRGGDGGAGGDGAGGGGGCGGLSAGIFYRGIEVADLGQWRVQNIFPGTGAAARWPRRAVFDQSGTRRRRW